MPESDILLQWFKRNSCNLSQPSDICKRTHNLLKLYTRFRFRSVYTKRQHQRCDDAGNTFSAIVMLNFNVHTNGKDTCERTLTPTLRLRFSIFFPILLLLQNSHANQLQKTTPQKKSLVSPFSVNRYSINSNYQGKVFSGLDNKLQWKIYSRYSTAAICNVNHKCS